MDAFREQRSRDKIERLAAVLKAELESFVAVLLVVLPDAEIQVTESAT